MSETFNIKIISNSGLDHELLKSYVWFIWYLAHCMSDCGKLIMSAGKKHDILPGIQPHFILLGICPFTLSLSNSDYRYRYKYQYRYRCRDGDIDKNMHIHRVTMYVYMYVYIYMCVYIHAYKCAHTYKRQEASPTYI